MRKCVLVLWCVFLSKLSIVVFPLFAAISVLWFLSVGISIVCLFDLLFCSVWVKTCRESGMWTEELMFIIRFNG